MNAQQLFSVQNPLSKVMNPEGDNVDAKLHENLLLAH